MGLSKRILDKIEQKCGSDEAMLDFMHDIAIYEFQDQAQYKKEYIAKIRKYAKEKEGEAK